MEKRSFRGKSFGPDHPAGKKLEERCDKSGIKWRWDKDIVSVRRVAKVGLPCGSEVREVCLLCEEHVDKLLEFRFEDWSFIENYWAIFSTQVGRIEAYVKPLEGHDPDWIYLILSGRSSEVAEDETELVLTLSQSADNKDLKVSIGPPSEELQSLCLQGVEWLEAPSIKIEKAHVSNHTEALSMLEDVSNAVFFEMDLMINFPVGLTRFEPPSKLWYYMGEVAPELRVPDRNYGTKPMELYWYARTAGPMPLLQFLSYYQCIEFYFPKYWMQETCSKIRDILKEPEFEIEEDSDVGRLVEAMSPITKHGNRSEEAQLKSVFRACLDQNDLKTFLACSMERKKHFSRQSSGVQAHSIPFNDSKADLRNEIATRLYRLRCRIVHSKDEGGGRDEPPLFPYSPESRLLGPDIELIQYAARKVLIAASHRLVI